jgi:hypothetical protein
MLYSNTDTHGSTTRTVSKVLQFGLWMMIVAIAFFMQVVPFLLVLTMFNLAIGVTSGAALILIPVVAFGMFFFACWIASRKTDFFTGEAQAREHAKRQIYIAPYPKRDGPMPPRGMHSGLAAHLQRFRSHLY